MSVTPWYAANAAANAAHLAWLAYERAVSCPEGTRGVGVAAARTALFAAMRACEAARGGGDERRGDPDGDAG